MAHMRKQFRDAAATLLTGLPTTGANVFKTRTHAVGPDKRPALCIYTMDESAQKAEPVGRIIRMLDLVVEAVVDATAAVDDLADQICAEVEVALGANETFGGLALESWLSSTRIAFNGEGETRTAHAVMTFTVRYRTQITDPTLPK